MASVSSSQSSYRQGNTGSNRGANNSMDVGNDAIARMAREDTRWFAAAVIILSLVLFLALPLAVLVAVTTMRINVDTMRLKAEVKTELKQLKQLKAELKEK